MTQPLPRPGRLAVWPELQKRTMSPAARALLTERNALGLERYGQEMMTEDGRDSWQDLLEELADAVYYAHKLDMETGYDGPALTDITLWILELALNLRATNGPTSS